MRAHHPSFPLNQLAAATTRGSISDDLGGESRGQSVRCITICQVGTELGAQDTGALFELASWTIGNSWSLTLAPDPIAVTGGGDDRGGAAKLLRFGRLLCGVVGGPRYAGAALFER